MVEPAHSRPNPKSTDSSTFFASLICRLQKSTIGYTARHMSVKAERLGSDEHKILCPNTIHPSLTALKEGKVLVPDPTVAGTQNCFVP